MYTLKNKNYIRKKIQNENVGDSKYHNQLIWDNCSLLVHYSQYLCHNNVLSYVWDKEM